jgi:hypothetical protein
MFVNLAPQRFKFEGKFILDGIIDIELFKFCESYSKFGLKTGILFELEKGIIGCELSFKISDFNSSSSEFSSLDSSSEPVSEFIFLFLRNSSNYLSS